MGSNSPGCDVKRTRRLVRGSAVVDVDKDPVGSTTALSRVALASKAAASRDRVCTSSDERGGRSGSATVALGVVLGTAVWKSGCGTGVQAVGDSHVAPAADCAEALG